MNEDSTHSESSQAPSGHLLTLRGEGLGKRYKKRFVVSDVNIEVKQCEVVGLLGPNGAGKTTTFYIVVGMIRPTAGQVYIDQNEITREPMYKRARMGIGYLSQRRLKTRCHSRGPASP